MASRAMRLVDMSLARHAARKQGLGTQEKVFQVAEDDGRPVVQRLDGHDSRRGGSLATLHSEVLT